MEAWELKAGLEVILGSANRELTLSDLARGLGVDERAAEDASRRSMRFGESRVWSWVRLFINHDNVDCHGQFPC